MSVNPYESPQTETKALEPTRPRSVTSYTGGTITARYLAASVDFVIAATLAIIAAKSLPESAEVFQGPVAIVVWFAYYLVPEAVLSRTLGKLLLGLIVVRMDGSRITGLQAIIRTAFRILEVNPFLLGGLPAGLCVIFSKNRQRFGDKAAKTLVVPVKSLEGLRSA